MYDGETLTETTAGSGATSGAESSPDHNGATATATEATPEVDAYASLETTTETGTSDEPPPNSSDAQKANWMELRKSRDEWKGRAETVEAIVQKVQPFEHVIDDVGSIYNDFLGAVKPNPVAFDQQLYELNPVARREYIGYLLEDERFVDAALERHFNRPASEIRAALQSGGRTTGQPAAPTPAAQTGALESTLQDELTEALDYLSPELRAHIEQALTRTTPSASDDERKRYEDIQRRLDAQEAARQQEATRVAVEEHDAPFDDHLATLIESRAHVPRTIKDETGAVKDNPQFYRIAAYIATQFQTDKPAIEALNDSRRAHFEKQRAAKEGLARVVRAHIERVFTTAAGDVLGPLNAQRAAATDAATRALASPANAAPTSTSAPAHGQDGKEDLEVRLNRIRAQAGVG